MRDSCCRGSGAPLAGVRGRVYVASVVASEYERLSWLGCALFIIVKSESRGAGGVAGARC